MSYALTEHPEGGLVACPWEGVTVRAEIRPRPTMSFAERERRAPAHTKPEPAVGVGSALTTIGEY